MSKLNPDNNNDTKEKKGDTANVLSNQKKPVKSIDNSTFKTLARQRQNILPSQTAPHYPKLAKLPLAHIESFNSIFQFGHNQPGLLDLSIQDIGTTVIFDSKIASPARNKLTIWIANVSIGKPVIDTSKGSLSSVLYPSECRERGHSYRSKIHAKICWKVGDGPIESELKNMGNLPVIVRSTKCHLFEKSPKELVKHKEDPEEFGGYFIVNGIERLIRLLIVTKRNHCLALNRSSFGKRGPTYTPFGIQIRSVRKDETSQTMTLHYCTDGAMNIRFSFRKQEYMIPVLLILRALKSCTDRDVYENVAAGSIAKDTFVTDRLELLLYGFQKYELFSKKQCLEYIGSKFAVMLDSPDDCTTEQVGIEFLKKIILVHLEKPEDKFDLLIFMIRKLYALVAGECAPDNPDSPQHQELLLGGHLYNMYMKEKFADYLSQIKLQIQTDIRKSPTSVDFHDKKYVQKVLGKVNGDIGKKMEYFLATGNLVSGTGLDLQQVSGFTVVAEKLNYMRYISHFRSVHRGAYFAELKTTTVRKLLPEAWGFFCPVHTPDGAPCGLLNHLAHACEIITHPLNVDGIPDLLASLGVSQMIAPPPALNALSDSESEDEDESQLSNTIINVQLDGKVLGYTSPERALVIVRTLRHLKISKHPSVPLTLEVGYVPPSVGGQYPGLFLFSSPARMTRPVTYIATGDIDYVGPFEQVYMDIACMNEDVVPGVTTHMEVSPTNILSVVANMTPFSDFNQSPRNMYQCQMGKQTMGTPSVNLKHRTDNKLYRIQTGQTPIVRPKLHDDYGFDGYPNGINAVVAVISYTGYDMEDASIINKSAHERGYGYGSVYKAEFVDLNEKRKRNEPITCHFGIFTGNEGDIDAKNSRKLEELGKFLDIDGLPHIGVRLTSGDPMYAYVDDTTSTLHVTKYKGTEIAYVDEVKIVGCDTGDEPLQKVLIKLRIPRPPQVGDKFSSRHGQKGVISQKWPTIDMPFSETGIVPDVIINPHAFPSRMTIGMFVESLAGKAGALHGTAQESSPFTFNEDNTAADYFGHQLKSQGFNFHGNEPLYSGITGQEFKADIYMGVVFYQRLRHMVSDKYQVRTTGPVHDLTQQPVKGRKRAGGIRFGEMERDSLLAHGVSFLLQDRLFNCSDYSQSYVCKSCGSVLSPMHVAESIDEGKRGGMWCCVCESGRDIDIIAVPYVFRYLCTELAAMNVRLKLEIV